MVKVTLNVILVLVLLSVFTFHVYGEKGEFKYVGTKNCKMCHSSKKSGQAFKIWRASSHAKAFETLASEESKAIAKKMEIDDPQTSDQCLSCHITGHGKPASKFDEKYVKEEGVTCEACHGPGSGYNTMKIMKQISAGEVKGADAGLIDPNEENCTSCHNKKSPTFKGFEYKKYVDMIAHPVPKK